MLIRLLGCIYLHSRLNRNMFKTVLPSYVCTLSVLCLLRVWTNQLSSWSVLSAGKKCILRCVHGSIQNIRGQIECFFSSTVLGQTHKVFCANDVQVQKRPEMLHLMTLKRKLCSGKPGRHVHRTSVKIIMVMQSSIINISNGILDFVAAKE